MEVKSDCKCMPSDIQAGDETARVVLPSEEFCMEIINSSVHGPVQSSQEVSLSEVVNLGESMHWLVST